MRDTVKWRKKLCEMLRQSSYLRDYAKETLSEGSQAAQEREVERLARLIAGVELGLTLLQLVSTAEPASSVAALLSGYRFPIDSLQREENWELVRKARFYLLRHKGRQWLRSLETYMNLPEIVRIYSLSTPDAPPKLIPSSVYSRRLEEVYMPTLHQTPSHQTQRVKFASPGRWFCRIAQPGHTPVEIPIEIPDAVANLATTCEVSLHHTREARNPSHKVLWDDLLASAQEMDFTLSESGYGSEDYYARLQRIEPNLYETEIDDFQPGTALKLEKLVHIVGLLNVGKSTLLEVLIYHFAQRGYRCALIVNDVAASIRTASLFRHKLGIPAAPILGKNRSEQLDKVYEPILKNSGEDMTQGGMHEALRWFSPICPLLSLVRSEENWRFGQEPCHDLYQKVSTKKDADIGLHDEDLDPEAYEFNNKATCPLYYKCPQHQIEQDIATSLIWILTPSSFIHSRVPRQAFHSSMTYAESVYQECDFLFVDEADRVQVKFDEEFAPNQVLVDDSESSFLNRLGLNISTIYSSDRSSMMGDRFVAWTSAHYHAQNATNRIYHLLLNQPQLAEWLGQKVFTGFSLFARIIYELTQPTIETESPESSSKSKQTRHQHLVSGASPQPERRHRTELLEHLREFLQSPLDRRQGGELAELALTILSRAPDRHVLSEIADWCEKWLQESQISVPDKTEVQWLAQRVQLAILTAVLDNQLGFLVDHLAELGGSRLIDLHNLRQSILNRPPRAYLPVVPDAPVGNILGFMYKRDRRHSRRGGKLEYFRYVGVGRALLLQFPELFSADDWDGPHTILISGTSYAPGSPTYHLRPSPTILLKPKPTHQSDSEAGIHDSAFFFSPLRNLSDGKHIALSGLPLAKRRQAADQLVKAMQFTSGNALNFLTQRFQELNDLEEKMPAWWSDRQRLLMVTGSYDEGEWVHSVLSPLYRINSLDEEEIAPLRRNNAPVHLKGIRQGEIQNLRQTSTQIVIAPLMALERGHNILNAEKKAAFETVLFLNRPMPVPDDWQLTVRQLNNWAIVHERDSTLYEMAISRDPTISLTNIAEIFYRHAVSKMIDLTCTAYSFNQLTEDERSVLCWTQLVSIWQIIGRLLRGGVPARVYFIDVRFAGHPHKAGQIAVDRVL